jgi:hypothetical protein
MRIRHPDGFIWGYNSITSLDGDHSDMLMDFGILKLNQGMVFTDDSSWKRSICCFQAVWLSNAQDRRMKSGARVFSMMRSG